MAETTEPMTPYEEPENETVIVQLDKDIHMAGNAVTTESHGTVTELVAETSGFNKEDEVNEEKGDNDKEMKEIKDENELEVQDKDDRILINTETTEQNVDRDSVTENENIATSTAEPVHTEIVTSSEIEKEGKEVNIGAAVDKNSEKTPEQDNRYYETTPKHADEDYEMKPEQTDKNYETTPEQEYNDDWMLKAVDEPETVVDNVVQLEPIGNDVFVTL